jgi:biotin-(acetyl-CoA carboxylase) ligase
VALAAASLAEACPGAQSPPSALAVLPLLRRYLLEACGMIQAGGWPQLLPALRQRDCLLGRRVRIEQGGRASLGVAEGIDAEGRLELMTEGGGRLVCDGGTVAAIG